MKILDLKFLPNVYVGIVSFNRGDLSVDDIISSIKMGDIIVAILSRKAVISDNQILNAVYNYMNMIDFHKWIRNKGLRLLALIVGERQIDKALKIANVDDQELILIAVSDNIERFNELIDTLRRLNVQIYDTVKYAKPEEFSMLYSFKSKNSNELELDILRKQAMLRIEIYKAF